MDVDRAPHPRRSLARFGGLAAGVAMLLWPAAAPAEAPGASAGRRADWKPEAMTSEVRGSFRRLAFGPAYHARLGRDAFFATRLVTRGGYAWAARSFGVSRIELATGRAVYLALPAAHDGSGITDILPTARSLWVGGADGVVYRHTAADGRWRSWRVAPAGPVSLALLDDAVTAVVRVPGGAVLTWSEPRDVFDARFALPAGFPARPWRVVDGGRWKYLCTDAGLVRFTLGQKDQQWELLGSRDGLSVAAVLDAVPDTTGRFWIVAGARPQYPLVPGHVKLTSYGTFLFDTLQQRWERRADFPAGDQAAFLRANAAAAGVPPGGTWLYAPQTDRAARFIEFPVDTLRIIPYGPGAYLAASRRGLYHVRREAGRHVMARVAGAPRDWIDDAAVAGGKLLLLTRDGILVHDGKSLPADTGEGRADRTGPGARERRSAGDGSEADVFLRQIEGYLKSLRGR